MKGKIILATLVCIVVFSVPVSAQKKIFSGFYLTPGGEKVEGTFGNYQQWDINPSEVIFVSPTAGSAISLTPSNCQGFLVDGYDEYLAYTGKRLVNMIGDAQTLINAGSETSADQPVEISTFLRLVRRTAACDLYIFKDKIRTNFFIKLPGKPLTELRYKEFYSQGQIKEFPEYKQQLQGFFSGEINRQQLQGELTDLLYSEEAMLYFFGRLFPSEKKMAKPNKQYDGWIMSAGVALNFLKIDGGGNTAVESRQSYNASAAPLFSVGYMLTSNRNFGKYFFYPQLKVFRYQHSVNTIDNGMKTTILFHSNLILLPELNGGVNIVNKNDVAFQLSLGAGFMYFFNNEHIRNRYDITNGELYFTAQDDLYKTGMSANIAAGVLLKNKFLASVSYQIPATIGQFTYYAPVYSCLMIRVGYKLR